MVLTETYRPIQPRRTYRNKFACDVLYVRPDREQQERKSSQPLRYPDSFPCGTYFAESLSSPTSFHIGPSGIAIPDRSGASDRPCPFYRTKGHDYFRVAWGGGKTTSQVCEEKSYGTAGRFLKSSSTTFNRQRASI